MTLAKRYKAAEDGTTSIEYALLAFLMTIAIFAALLDSRGHLTSILTSVSAALQ